MMSDGKIEFMSKDASVKLKGLAIIIMVYLHCFLKQDSQCVPICTFLDTNGDYLWFHKFCNICVPLYMTLSGYGVFVSTHSFPDSRKRIIKLLRISTFVGLLWLPLSVIYSDLGWTFGNGEFFMNITGFNPYNNEWWFIAPWILLTLSSSFQIRFLTRYKALYVFITICLYLVGKLIAHNDICSTYRSVQVFASTCICNLSYGLGLLLALYRYRIVGVRLNRLACVSFLISLIIIRCTLITTGFFDPLIAAFFIIFWCKSGMLNNDNLLTRLLVNLGFQNTYIWLIHTFICCYYFHDIIFSFKYPILIFSTLLLISFLAASFTKKLQDMLDMGIIGIYNKFTSKQS